MDKDQKKVFEDKIKTEIRELKLIQQILQIKKPSYEFLDPTINNAIASLVDILLYLEGKNPYYKEFSVDFFNYRQTAMHREFFSNLFIDTETGLRNTISFVKIEVEIGRQRLANSIVESIRKKIRKSQTIEKELHQVIRLGGKFPTFNDFLNSLLSNLPKLNEGYKLECRIYFDALNIIRNKISHSDEKLSEIEKGKLKRAKFSKAITKDGLLQMTFEGYRLLLNDIIRFFDHIYASL